MKKSSILFPVIFLLLGAALLLAQPYFEEQRELERSHYQEAQGELYTAFGLSVVGQADYNEAEAEYKAQTKAYRTYNALYKTADIIGWPLLLMGITLTVVNMKNRDDGSPVTPMYTNKHLS